MGSPGWVEDARSQPKRKKYEVLNDKIVAVQRYAIFLNLLFINIYREYSRKQKYE